jgi:predicted DNA-binding antitoxin AbrB/MazE fold protein
MPVCGCKIYQSIINLADRAAPLDRPTQNFRYTRTYRLANHLTMPDLTVTYEAGVLKPTIPLTLREGQTLQIRILETDIPEPPVNQAALDLLRSWREDGDEQEQKETWEFLQQSLDADRLSDRPLFPT